MGATATVGRVASRRHSVPDDAICAVGMHPMLCCNARRFSPSRNSRAEINADGDGR